MRTVSSDRIRDVADVILKQGIQRGIFAGGRLPTERDLAADLQLTRSTVRNAMALLEADGLVSREVGRGTYLRLDPGAGIANPNIDSLENAPALKDVGPADVMAARLLIEPAAMYAIVARATEADFEEMTRCLRGWESAGTYDEFEMWDLSFHRCLITATHNALLARMYVLVEAARQGDLWGDLKRRSDSSKRREQYCEQHLAIAAALRSRDGREAEDAMRTHLDSVESYLEMSARS